MWLFFMAGIYLYRYMKNVSLRTGLAAAGVLRLVVFIPLPERVTWYLFAVEGIFVVSDFLWQQEMRWIG